MGSGRQAEERAEADESAKMTWDEAIEAMKRGSYVRRKSQMYQRDITDEMDISGAFEGCRVVEEGEEGCFLAAAWTVNNQPVYVFMGACRYPFIPEPHHMEANDWVEVPREQA